MARTARSRPHRDPTFPLMILVDDQEKLPYLFDGITADKEQGGGTWWTMTRVENLMWGDYSLDGYADRVAIERKSLSDLYKTISQGRDRFARELEALNEYQFAEVVVEAEWSEVLTAPPERSQMPPRLVYRNYRAWRLRYPRVGWSFCPDRRWAEVHTFRLLERFLHDQQEQKR